MNKKTQITKVRNKSGHTTTNSTAVKGILRDYYKPLYTNRLDNLDDLIGFLESQNRRLYHEEIENQKTWN